MLDDITDALFHIEKKALDDPKYTLKEIVRLSKLTPNDFVVSNDKSKLEAAVKTLESVIPSDCKSKPLHYEYRTKQRSIIRTVRST